MTHNTDKVMKTRERMARILSPSAWPLDPDWHYKSIEMLMHNQSLMFADRLISAGATLPARDEIAEQDKTEGT